MNNTLTIPLAIPIICNTLSVSFINKTPIPTGVMTLITIIIGATIVISGSALYTRDALTELAQHIESGAIKDNPDLEKTMWRSVGFKAVDLPNTEKYFFVKD